MVVDNLGSGFLHNTVTSFVFDVSGDMQPYIAGLSGPATFVIYCAARAGNTVTLAVYDSGKSTTPNIPSSNFVNGQVIADHVDF